METKVKVSNKCEIWKEMSFLEKIRFVYGKITIEPMVICYILPSMLLQLGLQNLNIHKACVANLRYNETVCEALRNRNVAGLEKYFFFFNLEKIDKNVI